MSKITHSSRSDGYQSLSDSNRFDKLFNEWDEDGGPETLDANSIFNIINIANNKTSLAEVFSRYKINFEEQYNSTGWTHKALCPFPDHIEQQPSFGWNPKRDRFNCFGCNRGGRSVQFISFITDKSQIDIAKEIIESSEDDSIISFDCLNISELEDALFGYGKYAREFKSKLKTDSAIKYCEDISWNLDLYLRYNIELNSISISSIKNRILLLKEELNQYDYE